MKMTHVYRTWKSASDTYLWFDDYDCPVSQRTVTGEFRLHARTSCRQMIRFPYQALASLHRWLRRKILRMLVSSIVLPALQKMTQCVLWVRLSRMWRRVGTRILFNSFDGWCHLSSNTALFDVDVVSYYGTSSIPKHRNTLNDRWWERFNSFRIKDDQALYNL